MNTTIVEIFNDCVDRLFRGESIETCLALYPEFSEELKPLLLTAEATGKLTYLMPDPARKEAAKRRFLEIAQREPPPSRKIITFPMKLRTLVACLVATVILFALSAGSLSVSAESTPDDLWYPVKRAAERIQLLIARDEDDKAALHLQLADRRLRELQAIANQRGEVPASLLAEVLQETDAAAADIDKADEKEKLAEQLLSLTSRQQDVLRQVAAKAPPEAQDGLERAIERSSEDHRAASTAVANGKHGERRGSDDDNEKSGASSASSLDDPTVTAGVPASSTATAVVDSGSDDGDDSRGNGEANKGKGSKDDEKSRVPTSRAATSMPSRGDDNPRREGTSTAKPESSPVKTATPTRPDLHRGTSNGRSDSNNKESYMPDYKRSGD